jgi:FKBP-type peptidyl-prolyl cis-trans isomerase 2
VGASNGGRRRLVRILRIGGDFVVVDTNHLYAGQATVLEIEILEVEPRNTVPIP